jgi:hypothetical protein
MYTKAEEVLNEIKFEYKIRKQIKLKERLLIDKDKKFYVPKYLEIKNLMLSEELYDKIMNEEDLVFFDFKDFPCIIARGYITGALNGYIAIKKNSSFLAYMNYDNITDFISVHGGFTFTSEGGKDIWYKYDDERNELFWIGFDCGHTFDFTPYVPSFQGTYKDINYVKNEIESVVDQLEKLKDKKVIKDENKTK